MNRPRVKKVQDLVAKQERRLEEAKLDAFRALHDLRRAIEGSASWRSGGRVVSLRTLAFRARRAESFTGVLWSEASWMATHRRDLARVKAGKPRALRPGWSDKDVVRYAQRRARP